MEKTKKNCLSCKYSIFERCEKLKKEYSGKQQGKKYYNFKKSYVCSNFESMFIEYPIEVKKIDVNNKNSFLYRESIGKYCKVRYCKDNKTYLGLFLGELPHDISITYLVDKKILNASFRHNPAIFIFELNKIVFGFESWWGFIEKEEDLKEITDEDINNLWYVKALSQINTIDG